MLKFLLLSAFFNGLSWIILIPVWQYPDEQAHFAQVQNYAELGRKVYPPPDTSQEIILTEKILGTFRNGFGNNKYTYHPEFNIKYSSTRQGIFEDTIETLPISARIEFVKSEATANPPLYYMLGSIFYQISSSRSIFERVFTVRLFSLGSYMLLILTAYKISQVIFKNSKFFQYSFTILVAFMPMLVFSSTGILPDVLTNLLFTLVIFISLLILESGPKLKYLVFVISTIIAGSLTRQQFLISMPIILLAIVVRFFLEKKAKQIWVFLSFIALVVLLSTTMPSFWYIRDLSLPEVGKVNLNLVFSKDFLADLKVFYLETYNQTFAWYWGVYRWLSLTLPPISYKIIKIIVLISLFGVVIKITKDVLRRNFKKNLYFYFLIVSSLIYASVVVIWDYYFRLRHGFPFGIQGRYFLPLVVAHTSILLIGFWQISKIILRKYAVFGTLLLAVLMIIFNDFSLIHVAASYYDTSSINSFITQASQYKPPFVKGDRITFILFLNLALQLLLIVTLVKYAIKKTKENF